MKVGDDVHARGVVEVEPDDAAEDVEAYPRECGPGVTGRGVAHPHEAPYDGPFSGVVGRLDPDRVADVDPGELSHLHAATLPPLLR